MKRQSGAIRLKTSVFKLKDASETRFIFAVNKCYRLKEHPQSIDALTVLIIEFSRHVPGGFLVGKDLRRYCLVGTRVPVLSLVPAGSLDTSVIVNCVSDITALIG